jgi:hypothetical protein
MSGYFGHLYVYQNHLYVCDADSLFCIGWNGSIVWKATGLGIDGVVVEDFSEDRISGIGEWDPPGGWKHFELDPGTGRRIDAIS